MWCNLIRRKIRLHLSDQEIKSNQIKLTRTRRIICCPCQWSMILFPLVCFCFFLFRSISFYFSHLFFALFVSIWFLSFLFLSICITISLFTTLSSAFSSWLLLYFTTRITKFMNKFQNRNILKITFFFHIRKYSPSFHYFVQKLSFL